jgi:uncharacterized protein (DUF2062 family)
VSTGHVKPLHPWYTRLYRLARLDYFKILRTHGAPAQVARGVGYGIFVELIFFPTLGLGFFLIYPLNKYLKGHLAASIAGFVFAKLFAFLTIPPSFILGSKMLGLQDFGAKFMADDKLKPLGEIWLTVKQLFSSGELFQALAGWAAGAAVFGVVLGAIGFILTLIGLKKYQAHRKERREEILREKETRISRINTDEKISENQ